MTRASDTARILSGGAVINEDSNDVDFRIESDNLANAFFINGANGNIGMGTNSPDTTLDIEGAGDCTLSITANSTSNDSKIDFVQGSTIEGGITYDHNSSFGSEVLSFRAGNNGTHMFLDGNGVFKIGTQETDVVSTDGRHGIVINHNTANAYTVAKETLKQFEKSTQGISNKQLSNNNN